MNKRFLDLIVVNTGALLALVVVLLDLSNGPVRLAVTLPFVFLWPGYAIVALFMAQEQHLLKRLTLSIGYSCLLATLGAFVLHWSGWGINTYSWLAWLGALTLIPSLIVTQRRFTQPAERVTFPSLPFSRPQLGMMGLAVVLGLLAIRVALMGATYDPQSHFTQLWLTPARAVTNAQQFQVGIRNREQVWSNYRLELTIDGEKAQAWSTIALAPDEEWQTTFLLPDHAPAQPLIEAKLFQEQDPATLYRYVVIKPNRLQE